MDPHNPIDPENTPGISTPYINLQSDFGFKRAFGTERFRKVVIQFLDAALGDEINVTDVTFRDKEILPGTEEGKRIVYDIYCTMNVPSGGSALKLRHLDKGMRGMQVTHHFILEMQNVYEPPFEERIFYYASRLVADQGQRGWNYDLDPVITIAITDFDFSFLSKRLVQDFRIMERETGELLTDKLRLLFFSLRQVPERWEDCKNELQRQLYIIKNMEHLDKDSAPYKDGKYYELFNAAESGQLAAEDVVPYSRSLERLRSYQAGIDYAAEQSWISGLEKGRAEGMAKGIEKGMAKGREEGRMEGIQEQKEKLAYNLMSTEMDDTMIAGLTDLSIDQVKRLRELRKNGVI